MKLLRRIFARLLRELFDLRWRAARPGLVRLGTDYGGWWIDSARLARGSVAVCVGAGEDISFDVALNARLGCNVLTVDPTPRAVRHVEGFLAGHAFGPVLIENGPACYDAAGFDRSRFRFLPCALWSSDTTLRLFAPADAHHVSYSALNLQETREYIDVPARTLASVCIELATGAPALVKLDVEGAEYEIIDNMAAAGPLPAQLLVEFDEFHHPKSWAFVGRLLRALRVLRRRGYRVAHAERGNVLFVRPASDVAAAAR